MRITTIHYSHEIDRHIIENMVINPQRPEEIESILRDAGVSRVSEDGAARAIAGGALDLRTEAA